MHSGQDSEANQLVTWLRHWADLFKQIKTSDTLEFWFSLYSFLFKTLENAILLSDDEIFTDLHAPE